jgi:DNA uptake protein ComE-like DNA-binding protein
VTWIWAVGSLASFGIATPVLFAVAGSQTGNRSWTYAGVLYGILSWGGIVLAIAGPTDGTVSTLGGGMVLLAWIAGAAHAFAVRPEYQRRLAGGPDALQLARQVVAKRAEAQRLSKDEPQVARQMGVGRPDLPGAIDMGVVDVNHAGPAAIATLPGIDDALAADIVREREECDGFATLAEMGGVLDLAADTVEDLRPFVVFLPR